MKIFLVLITAPRGKGAELAKALVEERLAACVNVAPVRSVYRWKGRVEEDKEDILFVKTTEEKFGALRERVLQLHPYELPEIIAFPVEAGHEAYLKWVADECS